MTPSQVASANVRAELGRQNLFRVELVRRLGVNEMWLHRRLNDQVALSIDDLVRIAAALEVPVAALIGLKASA